MHMWMFMYAYIYIYIFIYMYMRRIPPAHTPFCRFDCSALGPLLSAAPSSHPRPRPADLDFPKIPNLHRAHTRRIPNN